MGTSQLEIILLIIGIGIGGLLIFFGLYLMLLETKLPHENNAELREIEVLGFKLRLSRPMLLIIMGVIVALLPFLPATLIANSSVPDQSKSNIYNDNRFTQKSTPVASFSTVDTEEYEVINDVRIFDLRSRVIVEEKDRDKPISRVRQTRYTRLKKMKKTDEIRYRYATSGYDVEPKCITHEGELMEKSKMGTGTVNDTRKLRKEYELIVDVSSVPVNSEFLLICEADYWNAFQGKKSEWVGAVTEYKTERLAILVIYSDSNPGRKFLKRQIEYGSKKRSQYTGEGPFVDSASNVYWVIENPKTKMTYEMEWDW